MSRLTDSYPSPSSFARRYPRRTITADSIQRALNALAKLGRVKWRGEIGSLNPMRYRANFPPSLALLNSHASAYFYGSTVLDGKVSSIGFDWNFVWQVSLRIELSADISRRIIIANDVLVMNFFFTIQTAVRRSGAEVFQM